MTFLIEGCVELGLTCSVSILMLDTHSWSTFAEAFSSSLAFVFAFALIIAFIYVIQAGLKYYGAVQRTK